MRDFTPNGQEQESIYAFALLDKVFAVHVDAIRASVHLGSPKLDELIQTSTESARLAVPLKSKHRFKRFRVCYRMIHSKCHIHCLL